MPVNLTLRALSSLTKSGSSTRTVVNSFCSLDPSSGFSFPSQCLMSDRDFRHVAGRQECLEFAIRKLFKHLHGRDEIVHET